MTDQISRTEQFVKQRLYGEGSGHDWWHIVRVRNLAVHLAEHEDADKTVVELAALLHDVADWKFHGGDEHAGSRLARQWLTELGAGADTTDHVCAIIDTVSFKGAGVACVKMSTKEGMVVQDADRLDAIGAIGIGRAFAYGGHAIRLMHDPDEKPYMHESFEAYKASKGTTINHFYEKLLLLKNRMNTETAKKMAARRHEYMERFLEQFFAEWQGER